MPSSNYCLLSTICFVRRAGNESDSSWSAARNGTIIEQQQILTTQNLAVLYLALDLKDLLRPLLQSMIEKCFHWPVNRVQVKSDSYHAKLIALKNSIYAWRQMVFFLSLLDSEEQQKIVAVFQEFLAKQPVEFQIRFSPVISRLVKAINCERVDDRDRIFLGWSFGGHWMISRSVYYTGVVKKNHAWPRTQWAPVEFRPVPPNGRK